MKTERYTETQRSLHINHTDPRIYGQSYVANTSSVDGRSAFLNEPAQHGPIDNFQSFEMFRETGLPVRLPAEREAAVKARLELAAMRSQIQHLKFMGKSPKAIKKLDNQLRAEYTKQMKKELKQYQEQWIQERRRWKIETRGKVELNNDCRTDLIDALSAIIPQYRRLTRTMICAHDITQSKRRQAIEDLYSFITRDFTVLYLPGEEPANGICPVKNCKTDVEK